jgi:hypothetical protein
MSEKKNNDYEKPESKGMGGDELEDVSAGAGATTKSGECESGSTPAGACITGDHAGYTCRDGAYAGRGYCATGDHVGSGGCTAGIEGS